MNSNFFKSSWIFLLIHGIIAIIIGLAFIFATKELVQTIIQIFGGFLALSSVVLIWRSATTYHARNYAVMLEGILFMVIALFLIFRPDLMQDFIIIFFGLWAMIAGGFEFYYGVRSGDYVKGNKLLIINGILFILLGAFMVFNRDIFLMLVGAVIGWIILLVGVVTIYYSLAFRRSIKTIEPIFEDNIIDVDADEVE